MMKTKIAAHNIRISDIFVIKLINSQTNCVAESCVPEFHNPNFSFFQTSIEKERQRDDKNR